MILYGQLIDKSTTDNNLNIEIIIRYLRSENPEDVPVELGSMSCQPQPDTAPAEEHEKLELTPAVG